MLPMATTVLAGEAGRLISRFTETGTVGQSKEPVNQPTEEVTAGSSCHPLGWGNQGKTLRLSETTS